MLHGNAFARCVELRPRPAPVHALRRILPRAVRPFRPAARAGTGLRETARARPGGPVGLAGRLL